MKNNVVRAIAPFLFLIFVVMAILTIARTGLSVWQHDRLVHSSDWLHIVLQGMRVESLFTCSLDYSSRACSFLLAKRGGAKNKLDDFSKSIVCWHYPIVFIYGICHTYVYFRIRPSTQSLICGIPHVSKRSVWDAVDRLQTQHF